MVQLFLAPFPKAKQFLLEFMTSLQFSAQGNTAQGTASITRQTLNDTVQELVAVGAGMAGGGRGPGGAMPGGGMPGGGMGGMPGGGMGGMPGGGKGGMPGGGGPGGGRGKGGGRGRGGPG